MELRNIEDVLAELNAVLKESNDENALNTNDPFRYYDSTQINIKVFQKKYETEDHEEKKVLLDTAYSNLRATDGFVTLQTALGQVAGALTFNFMWKRLLNDIKNNVQIDTQYYFGMSEMTEEVGLALDSLKSPVMNLDTAQFEFNKTEGYYVAVYKNNGEEDSFQVPINSDYIGGSYGTSISVEKNIIGFGFIDMNQWTADNELSLSLFSTLLSDGGFGYAAKSIEIVELGRSVEKLFEYGKDRALGAISDATLSGFEVERTAVINNATKLYAGIDTSGLDGDEKKLVNDLQTVATVLALVNPTTFLTFFTLETVKLGLVYIIDLCRNAMSGHNGEIALDYYESKLVNGQLPIELLIPERTSYTDVCEMSKFGSNTLVADLIDKNIVSGSEPSRGSGFKDSKLIA